MAFMIREELDADHQVVGVARLLGTVEGRAAFKICVGPGERQCALARGELPPA
jgi:hypothetical protein